jgi:hypothetical protein
VEGGGGELGGCEGKSDNETTRVTNSLSVNSRMDEEALPDAGINPLENSNAVSEPNLPNFSEMDQEPLTADDQCGQP